MEMHTNCTKSRRFSLRTGRGSVGYDLTIKEHLFTGQRSHLPPVKAEYRPPDSSQQKPSDKTGGGVCEIFAHEQWRISVCDLVRDADTRWMRAQWLQRPSPGVHL